MVWFGEQADTCVYSAPFLITTSGTCYVLVSQATLSRGGEATLSRGGESLVNVCRAIGSLCFSQGVDWPQVVAIKVYK